jgi:methylphosphotriester-DNA--protein-cysteine methyltransferase
VGLKSSGLDCSRSVEKSRLLAKIHDFNPAPLPKEVAGVAFGTSRIHQVFKAIAQPNLKTSTHGGAGETLRQEMTDSGSVTEVIGGTSFESSGRLYATSNNILDMPPSCFHAGGINTTSGPRPATYFLSQSHHL